MAKIINIRHDKLHLSRFFIDDHSSSLKFALRFNNQKEQAFFLASCSEIGIKHVESSEVDEQRRLAVDNFLLPDLSDKNVQEFLLRLIFS